ncbi:MAG: hypothetical protein Q7T08_13910, partial [Devosia sp.]|nr:hypothetical protein [Devosia sp.]
MSIRVAGQALKIAALTSLLLASVSLAGCSSLGLGSGDVTGSVAPSASAGGPQTMPQTLQPVSQQVAVGPFIPPEDIGGSGGLVTGSAPIGSVSTSTLPPLTGNETMSAQPSFAPSAKTASLGST